MLLLTHILPIIMQALVRLTEDVPNGNTSHATSEANEPKNRYQDKIPCKERVMYIQACISIFTLGLTNFLQTTTPVFT